MTASNDDDAIARDVARRAQRVIPGGTSTGSKRAEALYGRMETLAPTHYVRAHGCRVRASGGQELIDFTSALGAVTLGYAADDVSAAVRQAVEEGPVTGLAHVREVELAERLRAVVPVLERMRFLKSGAEAVAAAVRIARTATGRDVVIGCGYFGWLDWCSDAPGVPASMHADFRRIPFSDVAALEAAVTDAGARLAAVVLEPVVERLPDPAWIAAAREACDRAGAVLVFDEIKTGFRLHRGGFHTLTGVCPDLVVFGKAVANGYPLAVVGGSASVMEATTRTWISSTLAGESTALAAALAVIARHEREDVCAALHAAGERQMQLARSAISQAGRTDVEVQGIPVMWFLRHRDQASENRLAEALARRGVLLKRGPYNFPTLAHDDHAHDLLARTLADALIPGATA